MAERKRYSEEQILKVLQEIDAGASYCERGSEPRHQRPDDLRLAAEVSGHDQERPDGDANASGREPRLKHLVAELRLDNAALKELQKGKW